MKKLIVFVALMLVASFAVAQPTQKSLGTANLSGIKPVTVQSQSTQATAYQIPMAQTMPLADGSGNATVIVQTITVTKAQLQNAITQMNNQITKMQGMVTDAQAQLDAIVALEASAQVKTGS